MLLDADPLLLDYVMYHETLHKQRKFTRSGTKTIYHDQKFKRLESVFENQDEMEHKLQSLTLRTQHRNRSKPKSKPITKSFFSDLIDSLKKTVK